MQSTSEFDFPEKLREIIISGKCVAFIGSGLSMDCYRNTEGETRQRAIELIHYLGRRGSIEAGELLRKNQ